MPSQRHTLTRQIGQRLSAAGMTLTTAESCTGGGLAQAITAIPGSSTWFAIGWVTYANTTKQTFLGLTPEDFEQGAVSERVVVAMAQGAQQRSGADCAIAISGIAGPGGGSAEKPVGSVWIAWAGPWGAQAQAYHFSGGRHRIRQQSVNTALDRLLQLLTPPTKTPV